MTRSPCATNYSRSARRCHLTEEIGARRRELYAFDTFKPIDDNFNWSYIKPTLSKISASLAPHDGERTSRRDDRSQTSESPRTAEDSSLREKVAFERILDQIVARVANSDEFEYEKALTDIRSLSASVEADTNTPLILEDYLCIYNKYRMDAVLPKIWGVIKYSPALRIVHHYNSILVLPDPFDLHSAREAIEAKPFASIPRTLWPSYITAQCFFHHPTVKGIIDSSSSSTKVPATKTLPLTKKALKEIRKSLPQDTSEFLHDILHAPAVDLNQPGAYRVRLMMDRARATGDTKLLAALSSIVNEETLDGFDFALANEANTAFRNSLFS